MEPGVRKGVYIDVVFPTNVRVSLFCTRKRNEVSTDLTERKMKGEVRRGGGAYFILRYYCRTISWVTQGARSNQFV